jgi:hypothetical protein
MIKWLLTLLLIFFYSCFSEKENNSPCRLLATYKATFPSSFNFREDNTFDYMNGLSSGEGRYTLKDNLITLDKIGFDKFIKSTRLLIITVHPISGRSGKFLVQVDDKNNLIDSLHTFTILKDNRGSSPLW